MAKLSGSDDNEETEAVSLKFKRGLKGGVIRYARGMGRNLNTQVGIWVEVLVNDPELSLAVEKRAHALALGDSDPPDKPDPPKGKPALQHRAAPSRGEKERARQ